MASRVRTVLLVTFFTVVIWLFAEGESLRQEEVSTRVSFSSGSTATYVTPEGTWNGSVRIVLEGSTNAIDDARGALSGEVTLTAGLGRVPSEGGVHTINLLDALQDQERVRRSGVRILSVTPAQATVRVRELRTVELPLKIDLPGVEVEGAPTASPRSVVEVRVPADVIESMRGAGTWPPSVTATVASERLAGLRAGASVDRQADLVLPDSLSQDPAVSPPTARVNITFTVKARLESEEVRVPVWVLLPAAQAGSWTVELEAGAELLGVKVEGPLSQIERLRSREDRLIAVVQLSIDELTQRVSSKPVGFALLRGGSTAPLPESMRVTPERTNVPLTITKTGEGQ